MPPLASYVRTPYATPGLLSPMVKTSEVTIYPIFRAASRYLTAYGLLRSTKPQDTPGLSDTLKVTPGRPTQH